MRTSTGDTTTVYLNTRFVVQHMIQIPRKQVARDAKTQVGIAN